MEKIFESVLLNNQIGIWSFLICIGAAIITGFILAWLCYAHSESSKGFFTTISLLPAIVTMVILLVNGNIGAGVAVAGAFSLIRFRSAPGTAKEICIIFIDMACGLAFGMGFVAYGFIFAVIAGGFLLLFEKLNIWNKKNIDKKKILKITIPEDLDYTNVLSDLLDKYTESNELVKVKTLNMGSLFRITYLVELKDPSKEKEFIDEIRVRNGNLEVSTQRVDFEKFEL